MSSLEGGYRRLLAWYPQDHRAVHEDEMVGVLLASAEPGQTRPGLRDRADLMGGALRLHARRAFGRGSIGFWREATAAIAVVCTLLFAVRAGSEAVTRTLVDDMWIRQAVALLLAIVLLVSLAANSRLVAFPAAGLLSAYLITSWIPWLMPAADGGFPFHHSDRFDLLPVNVWVLLPLVAGLAAALSSRPRRGFSMLGWRRLAAWTGLAVGTIAWAQALNALAGQGHTAVETLPFLTVCAAACGFALRSQPGRRSLVVFVPLLTIQTVMCVYVAGSQSPWWLVAMVAAVPAVVLGTLGLRELRRDEAPEPAAQTQWDRGAA